MGCQQKDNELCSQLLCIHTSHHNHKLYRGQKHIKVIGFLVLLNLSFPVTVEPRLSRPQLSGFLNYPDFFSGPSLVMNINFISHDQDP